MQTATYFFDITREPDAIPFHSVNTQGQTNVYEAEDTEDASNL